MSNQVPKTVANAKLLHFKKNEFQDDLLHWFERNMRDLPWRQDKDAYKVWVSEIMLQQTRVDTVIPYYERFINRYPTLQDLAAAPEEDVLKMWEGLGYYSRVRNLHQAVQEVQERYGGVVPDDRDEIASLKGVGAYTRGAILSIAYGHKEPAVDGNVMRVMSRLFGIFENIQVAKTRRLFEELVSQLIPENAASYFNQGLMELGALVCTPRSPQCTVCPVHAYCYASEYGKQGELPVKQKKKKPKVHKMSAGVLLAAGKVLIRRRPETGLLAKLYEFPNVKWSEGSPSEHICKHLYKMYGLQTESIEELHSVQHTFTHLIWDISVFRLVLVDREDHSALNGITNTVTVKHTTNQTEKYMWAALEDLEKLPFSVSHQKIKAQLQSIL